MSAAPRLRDRVRRLLETRRALRLVWRSAPGWTVVSLVLVLFQAALPLAALYLLKLVVDTLTEAVNAPGAVGFDRVLLLIGLIAATGLISAAVRSLAALAGEAQGEAVTDRVLSILHRKSVEVDLAYYEDPRYHDTLHRAQSEAPYRPTRVLNNLLQVVQSGLTVIGIVALLISAHPAVAALLFAAVLPGLWVRFQHADRLYEWQRRRAGMQRRAMYLDRLLIEPWHAREVRLFALGGELMERFDRLRSGLRGEKIDITARRTRADLATQLVAALAVFGAYALVAYRTMGGALTIGDLVMYFGAVQRGQALLHTLFSGLGALYEDNLFLSTLDDFLRVEPKLVAPARARPVPEPLREGITVEGLAFRYPGSARRLLEEVDLAVRPGEMVALVGRNGSGKTTLVKLLARLYDPTAGRVAIDGVDLRELDPVQLRRRMTVVFQDYARYQMSAADNIGFGDVIRRDDRAAIRAAASRSGASGVIDRLPQGLDTTLGYYFEDGEELSTGEWQKVALARALFRAAPILILDEPTSALDSRSELEFFASVRERAQDRAVLIISHRFSSVRAADRIYVLDDGRIVGSGTHEELVDHDGLYAHMFVLQSRRDRLRRASPNGGADPACGAAPIGKAASVIGSDADHGRDSDVE